MRFFPLVSFYKPPRRGKNTNKRNTIVNPYGVGGRLTRTTVHLIIGDRLYMCVCVCCKSSEIVSRRTCVRRTYIRLLLLRMPALYNIHTIAH